MSRLKMWGRDVKGVLPEAGDTSLPRFRLAGGGSLLPAISTIMGRTRVTDYNGLVDLSPKAPPARLYIESRASSYKVNPTVYMLT